MSKISFFITILYKIEIKMRKTTSILIVLLAWAFHCPGQNKVTKEGLKYGKWVEEYDDDNERLKTSGFYKIIPLSTYDTIRPLFDDGFEIKFKRSTPLLFISGRYNNDISVQDGLWRTVTSTGQLYRTDFWDQGLWVWYKDFDDKGNMIYYHYNDFENDTSFYLTFKNNQLYKKAYYPPENKNASTEIFYPDNNLIIQNAEPYFETLFGDEILNVFPLKISCKHDLTITSVSSGSENIQVDFPSNTLPCKLTPADTVTFNLVFKPTPISFRDYDTITILTSEKNVPPYKVYCDLKASHINHRNVETLGDLTLSQSKDRYLIISPMGTVTDISIYDRNQTIKDIQIFSSSIAKIDLTEFSIGEYIVSIAGCSVGGFIKLKINE